MQNPNIAVLNALGIHTNHGTIAAADLVLRPGQLPTLTLTHHLVHPQASGFEIYTEHWELKQRIAPAVPFNLDAACAAAMGRITAQINDSAARHLQEMRAASVKPQIKLAVDAANLKAVADRVRSFGGAIKHLANASYADIWRDDHVEPGISPLVVGQAAAAIVIFLAGVGLVAWAAHALFTVIKGA